MKRTLLAAMLAALVIVLAYGAMNTRSSSVTDDYHQTRLNKLFGLGQPSFGGGAIAPAPAQEMPASGVAGAPLSPEAAAKSAQLQSTTDILVTNSNDTDAANSERLVVQTAQLTIVVSDVNGRVAALEQMAKTMGGYVVSVNVGQTYTADGTPEPQAQIVFRVPADQLDAALGQVKLNTVDVQNEVRSGQDVTNAYVDLQSRLTAKQAAADQLTKIMQNATKTQDVLDVYQQLQQVNSDIE